MFNVVPFSAGFSPIKKQRSAIISSLLSILSKKPDSSTMRLSEILPVNKLDKKQNEPFGVMATKDLNVL